MIPTPRPTFSKLPRPSKRPSRGARKIACDGCRSRHRACNGRVPCDHCYYQNLKCGYSMMTRKEFDGVNIGSDGDNGMRGERADGRQGGWLRTPVLTPSSLASPRPSNSTTFNLSDVFQLNPRGIEGKQDENTRCTHHASSQQPSSDRFRYTFPTDNYPQSQPRPADPIQSLATSLLNNEPQTPPSVSESDSLLPDLAKKADEVVNLINDFLAQKEEARRFVYESGINLRLR